MRISDWSSDVCSSDLEAHGIRALSVGMMIDTDRAIAWRGPMVAGALNQLLADAEWGDTDPIVLDMPPGTGDIQLTVVQKHRPVGAVIVSTPPDLALIDARQIGRSSCRERVCQYV